MMEIQVKSFRDIVEIIGPFPNSDDNPYYYRGLKKGFRITPSIAYPDTSKRLQTEADFLNYEEQTITAFRNHLYECFGINVYKLSDWNLWFLARHFGLKSRLTDFTKDFTVAFQFATEMSGSSPCHLYCLDRRAIAYKLQDELGDPFTYDELCLIQPTLQYRKTMESIGVSRMFVQSGKFLYQPMKNVQTPLLEQLGQEHWKILEIQPEHFAGIGKELRSAFGVDFSKPLVSTHIIDGICNHINQKHLGI